MDVLAIDFRRGRVHRSMRSITLQTASVWSVICVVFTLCCHLDPKPASSEFHGFL